MFFEKEKPLSDGSLGGGNQEKGSQNESICLEKRIERYSKAKSKQSEIVTYLDSDSSRKLPLASALDFEKISSKIRSCGNYLVFNNYYTVEKVRLAKASFCKTHLLCPLCAIRRGAKQVKSYLDKFEEITSKNANLTPYFLTLTVRNGFDLDERFEHLRKSVQKILKSRRNYSDNGRGFNEFCKIQGAVYSYELTYSKRWGWHPHIHMIVLVDKNDLIDFNPSNPKESKLSKDWLNLTKESFIVDCRKITGDLSQNDLSHAFCEVFKYALKFSSMDSKDAVLAYSHLKGKRLQGSFGVFRGVSPPSELTDELLDDLPYIELFYKYTRQGYSLETTKKFD